MVRCAFALFLLLLPISAFAVTQVTASVDHNPVIVNESFTLRVVANDDVRLDLLDTSMLLRDFLVGNASRRHSTQIINGVIKKETTWTLPLIARTAGEYEIPSFTIEGVSSQPITLKVVEKNQTGQLAYLDRDIYIEAEVNKEEVYIQQPFIYTVRLFLGVDINRGSLTDPVLEQAEITQIGKDNEEMTVVNGRRYRVFSRQYIVTPQQSGEFTLQSPSFSGEVIQKSNVNNLFANFGPTKAVQKVGPAIGVSVKPIPNNYDGHWLPAELVSINDELNEADEYRVGDPITRTITLSVAGNSELQLPEFNLSYPDDIHVYPDQAQTHQSMRNQTMISQRVESTALIITAPGTVTLPELRIPWFNVILNKMEEAVLPSRTITVVANPNANLAPPSSVTPATDSLPIKIDNVKPLSTIEQFAYPITMTLLCLWLITCLAWYAHVRTLRSALLPNQTQSPPASKRSGKSRSESRLERIVNLPEDSELVNALIEWANTHFAPHRFASIADIIEYCDDAELTNELNALQANLYSSLPQSWSKSVVIDKLKQHQGHVNQKKTDGLVPLHLSK